VRGLAWGAAGVGVIGLLIAGLVAWRSWLAAWYANLGTVRFAQVQLAEFPSSEWSVGAEAPQLEASRPLFDRALALNGSSVAAHYRLGLLEGLERDFGGAVEHLEPAYAEDPGHRGIHKALAYAYVWSGQIMQALPLLASLPEATSELKVYVWWWGTQDRDDLAQRAQDALMALAASPPAP
jgi:hypothetical protein